MHLPRFPAARALAALALAIAAATLAGCTAVVNSIQGAPIREIYPGQESTSALQANVHSRLRVTTKTVLGPPSTVYSTRESFHGSYWKYTTTASTVRNTTLQNTYSREESLSGTSEVWRIETEFLKGETDVVVLVQGAGFMPAAVLYENATTSEVAGGGGNGMRLSEYSRGDGVVAGVLRLKPGAKYHLLVAHAGEPVSASYRVAVFPRE